MEKYKIEYIKHPFVDTNNSSGQIEDNKVRFDIFVKNNISMNICVAMILGKSKNDIEQCGSFHRLLYGRYLAGFAFEGYSLLPPLCILQVVFKNIPHNAVCYNGMIYDPKLGVFTIAEYEKQNITILSYVQIFIPEAYENIDWKPFVPNEIQTEFEKDIELATFFNSLPSIQQSKIINYIYPFSKPSSFKESRSLSKSITPKKTQNIMSHIRTVMTHKIGKSAWEELREFETVEAVETLKKCGIVPGMTVLDMGCGHGHYTIPASIALSENGKVIAVDMDNKVLKHVEKRSVELNLKNITCLKTNEKGLSEYKESIDFIILYDVLHGLFNYTKADWGTTTKLEFISDLVSLLKENGILSLALYSEIDHKRVPVKTEKAKDSFKVVRISHEEAIQPYIELMHANGLKLYNVIENGGVHFDDFHNPAKWRKYGEVLVSSLERRNIYNFIKRNS